MNRTRPNNATGRALHDLEQLKYALDQSSIVAITDRHGVIEYANDKFVEISKYSREELVGKTHRVVNSKYHPPEYIEGLWKTILAGKVWRGELRNRAKDGSDYWVDTTITPLLDKAGQPERFIAIRNDITRRKELEQQKDEFMAVASHELKSPLTSAKAYVQLLKQLERQKRSGESVSLLAKVDEQIKKLDKLITELFDVAQIEAGKTHLEMAEFDLRELIESVAEEVQLSANSHRIVKQVDQLPLIQGDRDRIGQVVNNYLTNAIKYSPEASRIIIKAQAKKGRVRVLVQDFGPGIAKEEQRQIFKKYYRSNGGAQKYVKGLGLGLYISSEIIARHRGEVLVKSEPGKGSTFGFWLPAAA
jgi:PAS domain S-box-containing protein